MSELQDWQSGRECEKHFLAFCMDCRDQAHMRRNEDGEVVYASDCTVATLREITGADYEEAAEAMRAAGFRPGRGAYAHETRAAFETLGYKVTDVTSHGLTWALWASKAQGRCFWVTAKKGRKGHSWSITDGQQHRPYHPPFRYWLFEITA